MRILAIGDIHYVSDSSYIGLPERKYELGPEFVERILRRKKKILMLLLYVVILLIIITLYVQKMTLLKLKELLKKNKDHLFLSEEIMILNSVNFVNYPEIQHHL